MKLNDTARGLLTMMLGPGMAKKAIQMAAQIPERIRPSKKIPRIAACLDPFPSKRYAKKFYDQYEKYQRACEARRNS